MSLRKFHTTWDWPLSAGTTPVARGSVCSSKDGHSTGGRCDWDLYVYQSRRAYDLSA